MDTVNRVIALGFFDGVHLGHGALLSRCAQRARELNAVPAAFTFDLHPSALIPGKEPVPLLSTPADRAGLMERLYGIREVLIAHYDQAMMTTPWRQFITDYLLRDHAAVHLVVGHDFHFGYKGEGDPQKLQALCRELGVGCDVIPKVELEGITISSTYIRSLLSKGDMDRAAQFLGHPYVLTDTVSHGKKLGSTLGFPTVNLHFAPGLLIPAHGVYACKAVFENGDSRLAVTNIGIRPTVQDGDWVTAEGFLLDFDGDLYGRKVRMEFFHYLRPEQKFPSLEALRSEVMRNVQQTRAYFAP
ncbi:MAG: riboflavin biosynthesis protein RibF [Oscillospiraceae bacterium]|jgi:riboflavin kinase/FMN adenylyltransferase|nr:riboflavin biosynthesis protein RibF [Oscillospiraceae bacterium]